MENISRDEKKVRSCASTGRRYFSADHHFGHQNILKYCSNRHIFKDVEDMNEKLIENWNSVVTNDDEVIYLGDFSLTNNFLYLQNIFFRLNGIKFIVKGNHDTSRSRLERIGWINLSTGTNLLLENSNETLCLLSHNPSYYLIEGLESPKVVIHGHVHQIWKTKKEDEVCFINVGVDVWDYKPVSETEILNQITLLQTLNE